MTELERAVSQLLKSAPPEPRAPIDFDAVAHRVWHRGPANGTGFVLLAVAAAVVLVCGLGAVVLTTRSGRQATPSTSGSVPAPKASSSVPAVAEFGTVGSPAPEGFTPFYSSFGTPSDGWTAGPVQRGDLNCYGIIRTATAAARGP
jgi:hypothetical protein